MSNKKMSNKKMSNKSVFDELSEIKNNFLKDGNTEKLFRTLYALITCKERKCSQLTKKIELLEKEIKDLKKKNNQKIKLPPMYS